jgi:serine protease
MQSIRFGLVAAIALAAMPPLSAFAGTYSTGGLRDGERLSGVIVQYVDPVAVRDARNMQLRATTLFSNAVLRAQVAGARLAHVRQGVAGDVLRFEQPLDRQELTRLMRELAADPRVARVEPDLLLTHTAIARATTAPDDPGFATQWHFHDPVAGINAQQAWATTTGAGKIVAVVDTGIVPHADMDANVLPGYDFISTSWRSGRPTDGRAPGGIDLGDWSSPGECLAKGNDSSWHGTHVAGTIAQVTGNAHMGAGVAHGAKVLPVRVLGRCGGQLSDIADAVVWAAGGDVPGVPRNETPADVINLSLGGGGPCTVGNVMQNAIDIAASRGSVVVVSAGNGNVDASKQFPANCAQTVVVGATDIRGARTYYSNFGDFVDIAAPGGGKDPADGDAAFIWQAMNAGTTVATDDTFEGVVGTSMAAPHVAAVVALMQAVAPARMTGATVEHILRNSARAFPATPSMPIGAGMLDASLAVANAKAANACTMPAGCVPAQSTPAVDRVAARVDAGSGATNAGQVFRIVVPTGAKLASVRTFGGTGDATLLVRYGAEPMSNAFDHRSMRTGNTESVSFRFPKAGIWYVKVAGAHAGVSLHPRID